MLEKLLWCTSMILLVAAGWPGKARPINVEPRVWAPPPPPERSCGDPVEIVGALPDPDVVSDREGETVWLRNAGPTSVALDGWVLESGRRVLALDGRVLAAGERLALIGDALRPLRLANAGGEVRIRDPCGLVQALTWGDAKPGWAELDPREYPEPPWDTAVPTERELER